MGGPGKRRRRKRERWRLALVGLLALTLSSVMGLTAANVVDQSKASDGTTPLTIEPTKPSECDGIATTNTISGTGIVTGTIDNDWIIGSDAADTIEGLAGDDCIEGKASDDVIDGGLGNDVCIGGGGNDSFIGCETEIQ